MKRQMFFATVFSAALAAGVAAQTGTGTGTQPGSQKQEVTVTGCLMPAESAASGTSGTTGTAASGAARGQFILTKATVGGSSAAGTSGTAATPPSSAAGAADKYRLVGKTDELKDHVNARVEVKGSIDKEPASGAASGTATGATKSPQENLPALRVTSVKKIADSCS